MMCFLPLQLRGQAFVSIKKALYLSKRGSKTYNGLNNESF